MKNLGFGMMRLPVIGGEPTNFNYDELNRMVDAFLEAGYNYFDTSYVYHNGKSEETAHHSRLQNSRSTEVSHGTEFLYIRSSRHTASALYSLTRPALMTTITSRISWLKFRIWTSTANFRIRK